MHEDEARSEPVAPRTAVEVRLPRSLQSIASVPVAPGTRLCALIAITALAVFVATAMALQFLRADLDWIRAPLSFYLIDAHGAWLQAAYCGLAVGIATLATGLYRGLAPAARSAAPLFLFLLSAIALVVTALAHTNTPRHDATLEGWLHGTAAQGAFLCVTTAMVLQAWRFRGDDGWRPRFRTAFVLALASFIAVWLLALWRDAPRGLSQKLVVAMIVAWLLLAAVRLWRDPPRRPQHDDDRGPHHGV